MGTPTPIFWSAADGGRYVQFMHGVGGVLTPFVFNLAPLEVVNPPVFTAGAAGTPVIGGSGVIGSVVTVTDATYTSDTPATLERSWEVDGHEVGTTDAYTFPAPAGSVVRMRNAVANGGGAAASAWSNAITTIADAGAVAFPAQLAADSWAVVENATLPVRQVSFDPGTGFTLDTTNFDYYWVCLITGNAKPADITKSTKITDASGLTPRTGERDPGTSISSTLYIKRKSDGEERNASTGTVPTHTQELSGTPGTVTFAAIPVQPNPGLAEATGKAYSYYNLTGSHMQNAYHARVCTANALAAYRGNSGAVTWTIGQIKRWCTGNSAAQYEGGYYAQWDLMTSTVATIALRTPAVMSGLTAQEQSFLPLAIETGLYTGAALMADDNKLSPDRTMRGRDAPLKSVNPNIGAASIALVHMAMIHFGPAACITKLQGFDKVAWRNTLTAHGMLDAAALTYDGYTGSTTTPVTPPTNAQMKSWFAASPFKVRYFDMATQTQASILKNWNLIFGGNADGGEDMVGLSAQPTVILPGVKWHYGKDHAGNSPPAYASASVKVPHFQTGTRRGGFANMTDANLSTYNAATPFFGELGCIKEMNGIDEGGQRSSCSYSLNSSAIWMNEMAALMVVMPSWFDWRSDEVKAMLERARRGCVHLRYCSSGTSANPYLNLAKPNMDASSNFETWSPSHEGVRFAFNASFGLMFDVIFKWLRDSSLLAPLADPLDQWEDPVNWTY